MSSSGNRASVSPSTQAQKRDENPEKQLLSVLQAGTRRLDDQRAPPPEGFKVTFAPTKPSGPGSFTQCRYWPFDQVGAAFCVNVDALDLDLDENQENLPSVVDRYAMLHHAPHAPMSPPLDSAMRPGRRPEALELGSPVSVASSHADSGADVSFEEDGPDLSPVPQTVDMPVVQNELELPEQHVQLLHKRLQKNMSLYRCFYVNSGVDFVSVEPMALASIRLEDVEEGKSKFEVILRLPSGPTVHRTALQREGVNVDVSSLIEACMPGEGRRQWRLLPNQEGKTNALQLLDEAPATTSAIRLAVVDVAAWACGHTSRQFPMFLTALRRCAEKHNNESAEQPGFQLLPITGAQTEVHRAVSKDGVMALYVEGADAAKAVQRLTSMGLPPAAVTIIVQAQADGSLKTETLRLPSLSWIGPPLPPGPLGLSGCCQWLVVRAIEASQKAKQTMPWRAHKMEAYLARLRHTVAQLCPTKESSNAAIVLLAHPGHRVAAAPSQGGPASYKRSTEEKLTEANWRLAKANEDLQAQVKQLQADLLASERRFKGCYAENDRLSRRLTSVELQLNLPAEV